MQCSHAKTFIPRGQYLALTKPCGQCIQCRINKTNEWATRCKYEMESHDKSCFITLTYDEEHYPENGSLNKKDFQDFIKRVRKHYFGNEASELKYYLCGEYGPNTFRCHGHVAIFGVDFEPDEWIVFKEDASGLHYTSSTLLKLWPFGFNEVSLLNESRLNYVCGYIQKKLTGNAAAFYRERGWIAPFQLYSKNLGVKALVEDSGRLTQLFLNHKGKPLQTYYAHKLGLNEITTEDGYQLSYLYHKDAEEKRRAAYPDLSDFEYSKLILSKRLQTEIDLEEKYKSSRSGI